MATMRGFSHRIRAIANGVDRNANVMMRKTVITVASAVALRTPVDTGRARANWQTQIGAAATGLVNAYPKGKEGSTGAASAGVAVSQAVQTMAGYSKSGVAVYISNNLPYIDLLNKGSSKQAPAGFIQAAIMAGQRAIAKSRLVK